MTPDQPVSLVMVVAGMGAVIVLLFGLVGSLFARWFKSWGDGIKGEIQELCRANEKEHEDIWKRVNRHGHKIKSENGGYATAGVIVESER